MRMRHWEFPGNHGDGCADELKTKKQNGRVTVWGILH